MLGDRLKELRLKRQLTSEQLCDYLGIKGGSYRNYERNDRKPDYDTLIKLADFYDVSTDYILERPTAEVPKDPIDEIKMVNETERNLIRKWLSLDEKSREGFIEFLKEAISDKEKEK